MMRCEGPQESSIAGATQYFDITATNDNSDNDNDNSNNNNAGNNNNNNNANDNDGPPGGPAAAVPGSTAPLTAASLAAAPPAVQKQMIGEMLYPRIAKLQPEFAGKITGMMLEMDNSDLLILLESDAQLKGKVDEVLRNDNNNAGNNNNNNNANDNDNDIATTNNNNDNDRSIEVMPGDAKSTPDQDARGQRRFDELQALQTIKDQKKLREWEKELPNRPVRPTDPWSWKPKPVKPPSVYALTQLERRIDEYERLHPNAAQRWRHGRLKDGDVAAAGCEQFDMVRCPRGPFCELIITINSRGCQPMPPALWPSRLSLPPK
ncbi:unnamed protein product [Polarella glacialis]|uniref:PABC domain-containing protein n=1 Tax=Polarella glacialis TaxID=89957 RepID=A0A813E7L7_POLGL|nr:unnamed protein product [Polarella glacialis]